MANLGTPFVIGTLTSTTNTTTYVVPITTANGTPQTSDSFAVYAASSTAGSGAPSVSSVSDTKGNQYFLVNSSSTAQVISEWRAIDGIALTSSDTVTVVFGSATNNLKDICVVDIPGAATYPGGIDQVVSNFALSPNTGTISVSATPTEATELCMFASASGNGGGSPTNLASSGFTVLTTLHSGSSEYLQVGYQLITTAATVNASSTITGTGNQWAALLTTSLPNIQPQFIQQPFELSQMPNFMAFNPSFNGLRVGQVNPAITIPVNFAGSQTNIQTGVNPNFLSANNSGFETSIGSWVSGASGSAVSRITTNGHTGTACLQVAGGSTGTKAAINTNAAGLFTGNGLPTNAGDTVFVSAWFQAVTTARTCNAGIDFFDQNGNQVGSSAFGPNIIDTVGQWTYGYVQAVAPAGTYVSRARAQMLSTVASEAHLIDDIVLTNQTQFGSSSPGVPTIYQTYWQQYPLAPDGIPYPLSLFPTLQTLRRQITTANSFGTLAGVTATTSVSAPAGAILVTKPYFLQFPFPPVLQTFMQINPAFLSTRPQYNTGNAPTYIDGGAAGSVTAFNNFPDNTVTISVSATSNVAVVPSTPPTVIFGVTAKVNAGTSGNEVVIVVDIVPPNVSVAANPGTISVKRSGVVSNVSVAAPNGTVTLGPAIGPANVSVAAISGSLLVKVSGAVANTAVASSGVVTISPQGTTSNVSVAAISGTIKESIPGTAGTVNVASTGTAVISPRGVVSSVSVAANPGTIVISQIIHGVAANVNVASSGIAQVIVPGVSTAVSAAARAGSLSANVNGATAHVNVVANIGQDGHITISGFLVNPDLATDILMSDAGKLLDIDVSNILVSADNPQKQSQGI